MTFNIPCRSNPMPFYTYIDLSIPLTFTGKVATNAIQINKSGSPNSVSLEYSKNGGVWTNYTIGDIITLNQNDTVAFSGNNDHFSLDNTNYYQFAMTGTIQASGNIQSLMNFSDSAPSYCYISLFQYCSSLKTAPHLSATTLAAYCYQAMFNTTGLTAVPNDMLPATTLATGCYYNMFYNCASLSTAPDLPATKLVDYCYRYMFRTASNMSNIRVAFTAWKGLNSTQDWVNYISNTGTFYCPRALGTNASISRGRSNCPSNWTVVNTD